MKLKFAIVISLFLSCLILDSSAGLAASKKIKWYSYDEGLALGKQEGKKMFLHFYASWCPSCKEMNKKTFQNSRVIDYLNRHFISSRVNSDNARRLVSQYSVRGVPLTYFISEKGEKISSLPGYVPSDKLLNILKYIKTDSYKTMTFNKFLKAL